MEMIPLDELRVIAGQKRLALPIIEKDYAVTYLLFLLKEVEGIYFKGGTALNKIFLDHARLSEDLDFTLTTEVQKVEKKIREQLQNSLFKNIRSDKKVDKFVRLVVEYQLYHDQKTIFIDLNERGVLLTPSEKQVVQHFYPEYIPLFSVSTLSAKEMMAEKMSATISRNRPRDYFDMHKIIQKQFPLDIELVKKKCELSGVEFDILRMFNAAQKLRKRWNEDLASLLVEEITFQEVMTSLAKHFNLKEAKKKKAQEISFIRSQKELSITKNEHSHHPAML